MTANSEIMPLSGKYARDAILLFLEERALLKHYLF